MRKVRGDAPWRIRTYTWMRTLGATTASSKFAPLVLSPKSGHQPLVEQMPLLCNGIASARLAGARVVALDESQQRSATRYLGKAVSTDGRETLPSRARYARNRGGRATAATLTAHSWFHEDRAVSRDANERVEQFRSGPTNSKSSSRPITAAVGDKGEAWSAAVNVVGGLVLCVGRQKLCAGVAPGRCCVSFVAAFVGQGTRFAIGDVRTLRRRCATQGRSLRRSPGWRLAGFRRPLSCSSLLMLILGLCGDRTERLSGSHRPEHRPRRLGPWFGWMAPEVQPLAGDQVAVD